MIKKFTLVFLAVILIQLMHAAAQPGEWVQKKSLYNLVAGRKYAVAFSVKGKGYIGTGFSYGFGYLNAWNNDLWQYDTLTNTWTQMASMPVVGRQSATAFVIKDKAYVGCGSSGFGGEALNDLWEYDPATNSWLRKADMPNSGLNGPLSFALNNKGFVGFGFDSAGYYQKGIWAYDPEKNKWTRKNDFPANTIWESFAASNDSVAFAGLGFDARTNKYAADIWVYDRAKDKWTQKNNFSGQPRYGEASFIANNTLYIIGGENSNFKFVTDGWMYNSAADKWISIGKFPGQPRGGPVSFVIGNNAYMGTGYDATSNDRELGDLWELNTQNLAWRERASLGGGPRDLAVSFNVGRIGIIATGEDGTRFKKDVWAYNSEQDYWKKLADLNYGKNSATGFSIGDKMYIGLGLVDTSRSIFNPVSRSKDFWVFNPLKETWTQIADFAGGNRGAAISFVLNGKAYVGTGFADNGILTNDLWQYDPHSNTWTREADFPGSKRSYAVSFTINGKAYVGMGSGAQRNFKDIYAYDPIQNLWTAVADFPAKARGYSVAVAAGGKGYVGLGVDATSFYQDWWQFDPQQNTWTRQKDFPYLRWGASALNAGKNIYVGMGVPYTNGGDAIYAINDWWQFIPESSSTQENDAVSKILSSKIIVTPNPFKDHFQLEITGNIKNALTVVIVDESGKTIETKSVMANTVNYFGNKFYKGVFFIHVFNKEIQLPVQKIIKQ